MRTTIICTISLSPELAKRLDELARRHYRSRSGMIQELIRQRARELEFHSQDDRENQN